MTNALDTTKGYSNKSNANRAIKAAGSPAGYTVSDKKEDGKFYIVAPKKAKAAKKSEGGQRNGNCRKVWDMADAMPGERRKDVIEACVAAGIPLATAKTQYQLWFVSQRG